jgi:hypothetical protein
VEAIARLGTTPLETLSNLLRNAETVERKPAL